MRRFLCIVAALIVAFGFSSYTGKEAVYGLEEGRLVSEITLSDTGENLLKLQEGKLTLVHFWASYDAVSRINNIKLNQFAEKQSKGSVRLAVLSISLDTYQSVFEETLKTDGLSFKTNHCERQGFDSKLSAAFELNKKGFGNFLLNDKGVIIAQNLGPERLKQWLN